MEARLGEGLSREQPVASVISIVVAATPPVSAPNEMPGIPSLVATATASESGGEPAWPDEAAEYSFLADARERGEPVVAPKPLDDSPGEPEDKALPTLDELVGRIPAEVRETLEDLFRARFVSVKRIPKKALKT